MHEINFPYALPQSKEQTEGTFHRKYMKIELQIPSRVDHHNIIDGLEKEYVEDGNNV